MKLDVTTFDGETAGSVDLSDEIFGLEPRQDLIQRYVLWQLAKRQAGTHKTKGRAEIWRTGKKMYKQKGSGNARHGSARVPQFRGGGRAFGPVVRSPRARPSQEGARSGPAACPVGQGQATAALSSWTRRRWPKPRPRRCASSSASSV